MKETPRLLRIVADPEIVITNVYLSRPWAVRIQEAVNVNAPLCPILCWSHVVPLTARYDNGPIKPAVATAD